MQLEIFQLTEEENLGLIQSALSTAWPHVRFTYNLGEDGVDVHWTDGPWEHDVVKLAETYVADEPPTWDETIIISEPDGEIGLFYPCISFINASRTVSPNIQKAVITALNETGAHESNPANPHKLAALAELDQYSTPIPARVQNMDSARVDPADQQVVNLCHLLNDWCNNQSAFDENSYEELANSLRDSECRAVLASALSDETPVPGAVSQLIDELLSRLYDSGSYTEAGLAQSLVDAIFPQDDDLQPELFDSGDPRMDSLISLGHMLRSTVAEGAF